MKNLTIAVDKEALRKARVRALEEGTSVNRVLAEALERYARVDDAATALEAFVATARETPYASGSERWTREDLYDDRLG